MYDTYLPLLTYAHASGAAGSKVVPALAESLPKVTDGGKTYTLTLRKGLKYSDGTPVKASDFASHGRTDLQAQLARLALLRRHRRRGTVRQDQERRHLRDQDRRQDGQDHDRADPAARHLHQRARAALRRAGAARHAGQAPERKSAAGHRPLRDRQVRTRPRLVLRPQPAVGEDQRQADPRGAERPRRQDRHQGGPQRRDPGQRSRTQQDELDADPRARRPLQQSQGPLRRHPVPGRAPDQPLLLLDEHDEAALRRPQGAPSRQLRRRPRRAGTDLRRLARRRPPDPARRHARP